MRFSIIITTLLLVSVYPLVSRVLAAPNQTGRVPAATPAPTATPDQTGRPFAALRPVGEAPLATSTPLATPAPPTPTPAPPTPTPSPLPDLSGAPAPVLRGTLVISTYSLDFYQFPGGLPEESIRALAVPTERTIGVISQRMGSGLRGRVSIRFEPPQQGICAIRGLTISRDRTIRLFYEPDTDIQRIIRLLSHELFHQLQHDRYGTGPHARSDNILLEGMATWGSQDYFVDEQGNPTYQQEVRYGLDTGTLLPLVTDLDVDCRTTTRNNIYSQWASFVEYLIQTYGREKLDAVYVNSAGRKAGSAHYVGVYGKTLAELEAEWLEWLRVTQWGQ